MTPQAIAWPNVLASKIDKDSDLALVAQTKEGDAEAFSHLVRRHQRIVYNLAYRFMRDPVLAEDMAQEAFLKAFRLIKGFRGDSSFSTWMYRVTSSVCLAELGRRKKRGEVALLPGHVDKGHSPGYENADVPELIRRCVSKLRNNYAEIITLYYLKEISYEEIAQVMQIPMGTLKTWMHRARKELRKVVEKEMFSNEFD